MEPEIALAGLALGIAGAWPIVHSAWAFRAAAQGRSQLDAQQLAIWSRIVSPPFYTVGVFLVLFGLLDNLAYACVGGLAGGILVASQAYRIHRNYSTPLLASVQ